MRFWPPLPKFSSETSCLDPLVWKITAVAELGSFLAQLDATIVNVSLSSLAVDLDSSLTAIQWVTSGYLLALALMLPLNGWLVERIGAIRPPLMPWRTRNAINEFADQAAPHKAEASVNVEKHQR